MTSLGRAARALPLCVPIVLFAAGCGGSPDATPITGAPSIPFVPPPPARPPAPARFVPFDDAVVASGGVTCRADHFDAITAALPAGTYQFGDCDLAVERRDAVHGGVTVTIASGPAGDQKAPWSAAATVDSAAPRTIRVHVAQPRLELDWSDAPLVLRFDFADAAGAPAYTTLSLAPAKQDDLLTLGAPYVPTSLDVKVTSGADTWVERRPTRIARDGTPVFRHLEPIPFRTPITARDGVTITTLDARVTVTLDQRAPGDTCIFSGMNVAGDGDSALFGNFPLDPSAAPISALDVSTRSAGECADARPPLTLHGVVRFDARFGGAQPSARFAARLVNDELGDVLHGDVAIADGVLDAIHLRNDGDYSVPLAWMQVLGMACDGGAPANADDHALVSLETSRWAGVERRDPAVIAPGETLTIAASSVASAATAARTASGVTCASKRWRFQGLWVGEAAEPRGTATLRTDPFVVPE